MWTPPSEGISRSTLFVSKAVFPNLQAKEGRDIPGALRILMDEARGSEWAEEQEEEGRDDCLADSSSKKSVLPLVQESRSFSYHKAPSGHSSRKEPIKIPRSSSGPHHPRPSKVLPLCCTRSSPCEDGELTPPCMTLLSLGAHTTRSARPQPLAGEDPGRLQPLPVLPSSACHWPLVYNC